MDNFTKKLRKWGRTLPPKERALVDIIIVRSRGAIPGIGHVSTTVAHMLGGVLKTLTASDTQDVKWKDWYKKATANAGPGEY
jgi:hypothetical protein